MLVEMALMVETVLVTEPSDSDPGGDALLVVTALMVVAER